LDVTSPLLDDELANWVCFCREAEVRGSFSFSRAVETLPGASFVRRAVQTHALVTASAEIKRPTGFAGASHDIENLILELESLRDLLHAEGKRVQREISGYAQLSQANTKSTRMIADNVKQWKGSAEGLRNV
jgi:hypothetical protein